MRMVAYCGSMENVCDLKAFFPFRKPTAVSQYSWVREEHSVVGNMSVYLVQFDINICQSALQLLKRSWPYATRDCP